MVRIILTGTHGTGKTTILNHYRDELPVVTEVVRTLTKQGLKINEMGDEEGQKLIFDTHIKNLSEKHDYISDRGPTDAMAYTMYHYTEQGKISATELAREATELANFIEKNPDIIWCYFPVEFPVVDDGVRSTEEKFRKYVNDEIKSILERYHVKYHVITGTVEERIKTIDKIIKEHE